MKETTMCQHTCKCGKVWSHQDFGYPITGDITSFAPCPFGLGQTLYGPNGKLVYEHTEVCTHCYAEAQHKMNVDALISTWAYGIQRTNPQLSPEDALVRAEALAASKGYTNGKQKAMNKPTKPGTLDVRRIVEIQLEEEGIFKLLVAEMDDEKLEAHYHDLLEKMELFRVRALRYRQLKKDYDIEQLCKVSDADRAEFEEAKKRRDASKHTVNVAAVRKDKTEKMVESFAKQIMASNPKLSLEKAIERAKSMFA
jgi:hypothetical protein